MRRIIKQMFITIIVTLILAWTHSTRCKCGHMRGGSIRTQENTTPLAPTACPECHHSHLDPRERATDGSGHPVGHADRIQGRCEGRGDRTRLLVKPGGGVQGEPKIGGEKRSPKGSGVPSCRKKGGGGSRATPSGLGG